MESSRRGFVACWIRPVIPLQANIELAEPITQVWMVVVQLGGHPPVLCAGSSSDLNGGVLVINSLIEHVPVTVVDVVSCWINWD